MDASNYAIGAVLIQRDDKNIAHPVAFFSRTLNEAQRNYDIYNRELLALVETCRHWRQYLHQPAHTVEIHTDHANLLYWKNPGEHNRRVARWHAELMEYDFKLSHLAGKKNGRADALSRWPDYDTGEEDNKQLVVLPERLFVKTHARLAGTEEANPEDPQEWARFVKRIKQRNISIHQREGHFGAKDPRRPSKIKAMGQYVSVYQEGQHHIQRQANSRFQRKRSEEGGNSLLPRYPISWAPRNCKYVPANETRLLVAKHETGRGTICQGMRSMSSKQNQYAPSETCNVPHHTRKWTAIPNSSNGLHHEVTKVRQIQHHPYDHGSRLQ